MKSPYQLFDSTILRTPLFSVEESYNHIMNSPIFHEAVLVASPDYFRLWKRNKTDKGKNTLYKYAIRAANRCTPFGLFAGCSIVRISDGDNTCIKIDNQKIIRHTRLDLCFLSFLIKQVEQIPSVNWWLRYYPNDTIYFIHNEVRYINYSITPQYGKQHYISSVRTSKYLKKILRCAKNGETIKELSRQLMNFGIEENTASKYIHELIDAKILRSELSVSIVGDNPTDVFIQTLRDHRVNNNIVNLIYEIHSLLIKLNQEELGTGIDTYEKILTIANSLGMSGKDKCVIQTDIYKVIDEGIVSRCLIDQILDALPIFAKISIHNYNSFELETFKSKFKKRYDRRQIPLLVALDPDIGIGYGKQSIPFESDSLLAGIKFPSKLQKIERKSFLQGIIPRYFSEGEVVELSNEDLNSHSIDWNEYPSSMAIFCTLLKSEDGQNFVYIKNIGGTSALNTLTRFSYMSLFIKRLTEDIANREQACTNYNLATINHWPNERIGNVIQRPEIRKYEIPYLCTNSKNNATKITLNDLFVSIENEKIVLKSKSLSKDITPTIDNAHVYNFANNPIYYFLCDLQNQNKNTTVISYGIKIEEYGGFIPRIMYKNCIIHRAEWQILENEIKDYTETSQDNLINYFKRRHIPNNIIVTEGDNELFLDLTDDLSLQILLSYIKKKKRLIIAEDLYKIYNHPIIIDEKGLAYRNEFIIPIYK